MMKRLSIFQFFLMLSGLISAQNQPCGSPPPNGGIGCPESCVYCTLDGLTGNNNTFAYGFLCNGSLFVDRDVWFAFIPATTNISLDITSSNCQNGNGFQLALLSACQVGAELDCNLGQAGGEGLTLNISSSALVPGQIHYLLIDGYLADICDYSIDLVDGAFASPPSSIPPVDGPIAVCVGQTYTYMIPPVEGGITYTISAPAGSSINGQGSVLTVPAGTNSVNITFGNNTNGQICLTATTTCTSPPPACLQVEDCCVADAGSLQAGTVNACVNLSATIVHNGDQNLGPNDMLQFILFANPANPVGSILATSNTPSFSFDPSIMQIGQVYYVAAIAGLNVNGEVDLNDPCLDVSTPVQLIWRPEISVNFIIQSPDVCGGDCTNIDVILTGTAPFTLVVNDPVNGDRTFSFNTKSGTFQVCPPAGYVGPLVVEAIALQDVYYNCQ
jgi:hypothetical protein